MSDPQPIQLSQVQVAAGVQTLDTETLTGYVLDDGYVFLPSHDTAADVLDHLVEPASEEDHFTVTAAVTLTDDAVSWLVTVTGMAALDLSDIDNRGGIAWCLGTSPGDRFVGFTADIGPADGAYLPSFDDGLYEYPIESLATRLAAYDALLAEIDGGTL